MQETQESELLELKALPLQTLQQHRMRSASHATKHQPTYPSAGQHLLSQQSLPDTAPSTQAQPLAAGLCSGRHAPLSLTHGDAGITDVKAGSAGAKPVAEQERQQLHRPRSEVQPPAARTPTAAADAASSSAGRAGRVPGPKYIEIGVQSVESSDQPSFSSCKESIASFLSCRGIAADVQR